MSAPYTCHRCGREGERQYRRTSLGYRCEAEASCYHRMIRAASPGTVPGHWAGYVIASGRVSVLCSCSAYGGIHDTELEAQLWHAKHKRRVIDGEGKQLAVQV